MKIIEFTGLPCSGKTTLVKKLLVSNEGRSVDFHCGSISRENSKIIILIVLLHFPIIFFAIILSPWKLISSLRMSLYHCRLLVFLAAKKNTGSQVLVIDQGLVQSFASIFMDCFFVVSLKRLCEKVYFKLYLIAGLDVEVWYLSTPIKVVEKRLLSRKTLTSRFEIIRNDKLIKSLLKYESLLMIFAKGKITREVHEETDFNNLHDYLISANKG
jgi:hypothetical protein